MIPTEDDYIIETNQREAIYCLSNLRDVLEERKEFLSGEKYEKVLRILVKTSALIEAVRQATSSDDFETMFVTLVENLLPFVDAVNSAGYNGKSADVMEKTDKRIGRGVFKELREESGS